MYVTKYILRKYKKSRHLWRNNILGVSRADHEQSVQEEVKRAKATRTKVYYNLTRSCLSLFGRREMRRRVNGLPFVIEFRKTFRIRRVQSTSDFSILPKRNPGSFLKPAHISQRSMMKQIRKCFFLYNIRSRPTPKKR